MRFERNIVFWIAALAAVVGCCRFALSRYLASPLYTGNQPP